MNWGSIRLAATSMLAAGCVFAQATSVVQISGVITDANGGAISGAALKATQTGTGLVRSSASEFDGTSLVPYTGVDAGRLTVGGELNKLAANVAIGRNFAGIHYRSDYTQSLKLGEAVAISALRDRKLTYNESFEGFTFTRFDGTSITV